MKLRRNSKGFTLVEIMIVVAIIGLLAAIAVPNFTQARTNARTSACVNNLRLIDGAKQQWALETNADETDTPADDDILPYLKNSVMPTEPSSGTYTLNAVNAVPTCSVGSPHEL